MTISKDIQDDIINLLKYCKFKELCDKYFSENFCWEIKGTSVLSGIYDNKAEMYEKVLDRLNHTLLPGWKMHILNTYVDNNHFIVEMKGEVKTKAGNDYNNEYCWIFKFNATKLEKVTAYYDSLLVNNTLFENE